MFSNMIVFSKYMQNVNVLNMINDFSTLLSISTFQISFSRLVKLPFPLFPITSVNSTILEFSTSLNLDILSMMMHLAKLVILLLVLTDKNHNKYLMVIQQMVYYCHAEFFYSTSDVPDETRH